MHKAIGIDIGGTKIAIALVDEAGTILVRETFPTESEKGIAHTVKRIQYFIEELIQSQHVSLADLKGIGVGCAGPVNPKMGTVHNPFTLPGWDDAPIVNDLQQATGLKTQLENDADVAALGESNIGAGQGKNRVIMLTLGTGLGSGIISDGHIYRGSQGEHPELGHVPVLTNGPICYCGLNGCLESIVCGSAIEKAGKEFGFADSRDVFSQFNNGDPNAKSIITNTIDAMIVATQVIVYSYLPEVIILGGGIIDDHINVYAPAMRQFIEKAKMIPNDHIDVVKATLGNNAGMVGAAQLVL
ncbi:MAG: ROK family protein [Lentisphaeria bacterium]|nr:ROK family protein [Lentisphaeria bacterium]